MTDQYVTCRHCGIGINYQCDCDDDAAEERGREEVWGDVLDTLRTVYGRDMPYNESPCELVADLVPPGDVAAVREAAEVRYATRPSRDDRRVPYCDEQCPQHDGKRCRLMGVQPSSICEPEVLNLIAAIAARSTTKGGQP